MNTATSKFLQIFGKKYTYEILKFLEGKHNLRFKDLDLACPIEKMRNERLRELEDVGLIKVDIERIGRRPISVYSLSSNGKKVLKILKPLEIFIKEEVHDTGIKQKSII